MKDVKKVADKEIETEDWKEKYLRALADYQNLQKRVEEERVGMIKYANEQLILELLEVYDNLIKASEHLSDEGLKIVIKQLEDLFKKYGLEEIATDGDFDPQWHEGVEMVPGDEDNKICGVVKKGYKLYNKLIRPAKVRVTTKN